MDLTTQSPNQRPELENGETRAKDDPKARQREAQRQRKAENRARWARKCKRCHAYMFENEEGMLSCMICQQRAAQALAERQAREAAAEEWVEEEEHPVLVRFYQQRSLREQRLRQERAEFEDRWAEFRKKFDQALENEKAGASREASNHIVEVLHDHTEGI